MVAVAIDSAHFPVELNRVMLTGPFIGIPGIPLLFDLEEHLFSCLQACNGSLGDDAILTRDDLPEISRMAYDLPI